VRIKAAVLFVLFLVCLYLLKIITSEKYQDIILLVAAGLSVGAYFIRCETCKSSIYYRAGGERRFFPTPSSFGFLVAARCPCCGMERT